MFLLLTLTRQKRYHSIIYLGDKYICEDFLCIPDVFHMNYLIESYIERESKMRYYKFLKKGTYKTLHIGTELPPPGKLARPIPNIQPSGSAGSNSGVGYHMYPEAILPFITGDIYNDIADLWEARPCGYTQEFLMVKDPPAFVFPPEPMMCVVAESIELVKKVPFVVNEGRLTFCQEEVRSAI